MVSTRRMITLIESSKNSLNREQSLNTFDSADYFNSDTIPLFTVMQIYCQTQQEFVTCQNKLKFWTRLLEERSRALCNNSAK